mmetsp:Transcript_20549/g.36656  ORF Transcript_20549/g.36656 Transcript_20549/m.36656 type:complete len:221 (-) Transcript_20549:363-1025(-)
MSPPSERLSAGLAVGSLLEGFCRERGSGGRAPGREPAVRSQWQAISMLLPKACRAAEACGRSNPISASVSSSSAGGEEGRASFCSAMAAPLDGPTPDKFTRCRRGRRREISRSCCSVSGVLASASPACTNNQSIANSRWLLFSSKAFFTASSSKPISISCARWLALGSGKGAGSASSASSSPSSTGATPVLLALPLLGGCLLLLPTCMLLFSPSTAFKRL